MYKGKIRNIYDLGNNLLIETTDRISAFDFVMPFEIKNKGILLNSMTKFWFDYTKDIIENHMISTDLKDFPIEYQIEKYKDRCMLVKKLDMLPFEIIIRGYITGSAWDTYSKDKNHIFYLNKLNRNYKLSEKLDTPIVTPTSKVSYGGHDEEVTYKQVVDALGINLEKKVREVALKIYEKCSEYALEKGIIIADTKLEFGLDKNGELVLADEILTPDSSRFWDVNKYEVNSNIPSLDKQYMRDYLSNTAWDKKSEPPYLPEKVINEIGKKYADIAYRIMT